MIPETTTKTELFAAIQRLSEAHHQKALDPMSRSGDRLVEEAEVHLLSFLDRFDAPLCGDLFGDDKPAGIGVPYIPAIVDMGMFVDEMANLRRSAVRFFVEGWAWKDVTERLTSICLHNNTPSSVFNLIVDLYSSTYACIIEKGAAEASEG